MIPDTERSDATAQNNAVMVRPISTKENSFGYRAMTYPSLRHLLNFEDRDPPTVALAAQIDGRPGGLLLAILDSDRRRAEIKSIVSAPTVRRRGVATALMAAAEPALAARGAMRVSLRYPDDIAARPAIEALTARRGYPPTRVRSMHLQMSGSIIHANWMRERALPRGYEAVFWRDLPRDILTMLEAGDPSFDWVQPHLHPRRHASGYEPNASLALLKDGELRAWLIAHPLGDVLRISCAYAHPDQQRGAWITELIRRSTLAALDHGWRRASYTIDVNERRFFAFAQRYMRPAADHAANFVETAKRVVL